MQTPKKKILLADPSKELLLSIKQHKKAEKFQIESVYKGSKCIEKIKSFQPDLIVVDFMLPETHGIEVLKIAKNSSSNRKVGVIITCYHSLIQNYQSAVTLGVDYFLDKPFNASHLLDLIALFFQGKLSPPPFPHKQIVEAKELPETLPSQCQSYLKFWGTRGSNPVSGSEYVRFGGNTPCLEIRHEEDLVIIDAGSGLRNLGEVLHDFPKKQIHLLISHTHWDHLLGFPFFLPIYQKERDIHIWTPIGFEKTTKELFAGMLAHAYFPVGLDDIQSNLLFKDLQDSQTLSFGKIKISTHYSFHPGATLCFKIEINGHKIGYVTDNEFLYDCHLSLHQIEKKQTLFPPYQSLIDFLTGCDILIHEAQYTDEEYVQRVGWGHSSISNASILVKKAGIKKWIVTHHDPRHSDEFLLQKQQIQISMMKELDHECAVLFAYDGMTLSFD